MDANSKDKISYYPTHWSEWEPPTVSDTRYSRYRLAGPGEYEYEYYESDNISQPTNTSKNHSVYLPRASPEEGNEVLDNKYKVHKVSDFKVGMVFQVLWSEPTGGNGSNITLSNIDTTQSNLGYRIRRFVVIRPDKGFAICLPIRTYGGHGTLLHGVRPENHAIIYTSRRPKALQGETIVKSPIKVDVLKHGYKLSTASRLEYTKVYTVECNVRVFFFGKVQEGSLKTFILDYNASSDPSARTKSSSSKNKSSSSSSLPTIKSPFVQKVHIHSREYPGRIARGNVKIDPGNEGPSLITDNAMDYLGAVPTDDTYQVQSLGNPGFNIGGEVELDFTGEDGLSLQDRYYTAKFRHTAHIPGDYIMLLNEDFYLKTWPEKVPGVLLIRPGKAAEETPEEAAERERQSNEEYERQRQEWEADFQSNRNDQQTGQSSSQNDGHQGGYQYTGSYSNDYENQNGGR